MGLAKVQHRAPGDTKNELLPEKTPLPTVTEEPNYTQNESLGIMRPREKEQGEYGGTGGERGSRGWSTAQEESGPVKEISILRSASFAFAFTNAYGCSDRPRISFRILGRREEAPEQSVRTWWVQERLSCQAVNLRPRFRRKRRAVHRARI